MHNEKIIKMVGEEHLYKVACWFYNRKAIWCRTHFIALIKISKSLCSFALEGSIVVLIITVARKLDFNFLK